MTTIINLIALVCHVTGHDLSDTPQVQPKHNTAQLKSNVFQNVTELEFHTLVDEIFERISLLKKWKEGQASDQGNVGGALGDRAGAPGDGAAALGDRAGALGDGAAALGDRPAALGDGAAALGDGAVTFGEGALALGDRAVALDGGAVDLGEGAPALGDRATALGDRAVALDLSAIFGVGSTTLGDRSTTTVDEAEDDELLDFHLGNVAEVKHLKNLNKFLYLADLLYNGILMLAQKSSSQYGDGEGSLAFWKNSLADYQDEKKVLFYIDCL